MDEARHGVARRLARHAPRRGRDRGRVRHGALARRAGAPARPPPVLLEEREVGARDRAARHGRAGVLGGLRLPQLRRSMARTAVLRRLTWAIAEVVDRVDEAPRVHSLTFDVPEWPGHLPGQHIDVRLTAEDGYQAQRSYSISRPADGSRVT